ncbi:MAG: ABC transporter substrate-binding protein, partial [Desulfuromonadales bacterium]|nr:ABC transporter substrate-binding protein [Desulfuromonadales bacterium]
SGPFSFLGTSGRNGALMAIEEINAQGGVNGRPVELVVRNLEHNQATAHNAINELASEDVAGIIGPMTSEMSSLVVEAANSTKTVVLSPTSSTEQLSGQDDYFFRIYPGADEGSIKIAHYAYHDRGLKSFAVVYDMTNDAFSLSWLASFTRDYTVLGGNISTQVPFESLNPKVSYLSLAERVRDADIQGLLILANPYSTAMLCQNLSKVGMSDLPTYVTEWSFGPELIQYGGRQIDNLMLFKTVLDDTQNNAFFANYQKRYGAAPWFSSTHSYDATRLLLTALQQNNDQSQLKETLQHLGSFQGVQTDFSLDNFGDVIRPHYVVHFKEGRQRLIAQLDSH